MKKTLLILLMIIGSSCYGQSRIPLDSALKIMEDSGWLEASFDSTLAISFFGGATIKGRKKFGLDTIWVYQRERDTVLCLVMFTDTSLHPWVTENKRYVIFDTTRNGVLTGGYKKDTSYYRNYNIRLAYFYSVREIYKAGETVTSDDGNGVFWVANEYKKHLYYLDKNKQPLSKNIVVWMTK